MCIRDSVNVAKLSVLEFANMLSHGREGEWGPRGLFYVEDGDKIVAVDNRDGYAFTEEFDTCLLYTSRCV